jgi:hypothetical protein
MIRNRESTKTGERGIALISALMVMTMLLALGIAVVYSTTVDTVVTKSQRVGEESFFAADAGVGIARRALAQAVSEEIDKIRNGVTPFYSIPDSSVDVFPDVQVVPDPDAVPNDPFYQRVYARANELVRISARDQRLEDLNGSRFNVEFKPLSGTISLTKTDANNAVQIIVFHYALRVTGSTYAGGSATVNETGRLSSNITLARQSTAGSRSFSFSGFGAFFDVGDDPVNHPNYLLSPGIYSGAVHTNSHFGFYTGWQYTFRNVVSQVEPNIRDYLRGYVPLPTSDYQNSIHLSPDGYKQVTNVPLPTNVFSQEYAVINNTGLTDHNAGGSPIDPPGVIPTSNGNPVAVFDANGRVTADVLAANLRDSTNHPPVVNSGALAQGVYVASSDGNNLDGAGIYVQNDAADVQVYADAGGNQVYVIQQTNGNNTTTTTVTVNYSANTTTITDGPHTRTYSGVPTDKSGSKTDQTKWRKGAVVFVNGNINSLHGGKDSTKNQPAIASQTALTITATRSIRVTGDLKYADPVVNSDGTPVANISNVKNVLGLFTSDGNIYLDAKSAYSTSGLSVEIDAANCVFNSNTANDSQSPTGIEGGITTWYGSGHQTPGGGDRIKLVGSDVEKNNSIVDYSGGDTFFDARFSGGTFRPPFFPGTNYSLGPPPTASVPIITAVDSPYPTARSWFRENN